MAFCCLDPGLSVDDYFDGGDGVGGGFYGDAVWCGEMALAVGCLHFGLLGVWWGRFWVAQAVVLEKSEWEKSEWGAGWSGGMDIEICELEGAIALVNATTYQ